MAYLEENTGHDNVNIRIQLAEILGQVISTQGTSLLIDMLKDENSRVKKQVILSLGNINEKRALDQLFKILEDPNPNTREASVEALGRIPSPGRIAPLKKIVLDTHERMNLRKNALFALAKIQQEDTVKILLELLDNKEEILIYNALLAIGRMKSYDFINHGLKQQLKITLNQHLNRLEERKARWRKTRDEETDGYTKEQTEAWQARLKNLEPNEPMEFELAFALSRIDPGEEGIKLLSHHLVNVRQGACTGVGISRNVSLIERLYRLQKESNKPWARHAAYRAMDEILINLEAIGDNAELNQLEALFKELNAKEGPNFHPGVYTRMEWTVRFLRERVGQ